MSALLEVHDLGVSTAHGGVTVVRGVSYTVNRNEILCVVGESGSGKSVTAHAIMGLLPPDQLRVTQGRILYGGRDLVGLSAADWLGLRGSKFGMVFQEPMTALNPVMRVGRQVDEVLACHTSLNAAARKQRVLDLFGQVLLPDPRAMYDAFPFQLSGGQRQRVVIAMALALEPDVLIADEPTTALDVTTQAQILALIQDIQRRMGIGVIFITHDFGVVADIAHRIVVMRQGAVVEAGTADEILNRPRHPYTRQLIAAVPHKPEGKDEGAATPPLMTVAHLCKTYVTGGRRVEALRDISLEIRQGETLGLVGESGSGKSTLGSALIGLVAPDSGSVRLDGRELVGMTPRDFRPYRRQIQMVFQDPYASLNPRQRVVDSVAQGPIGFGQNRQAALREARELLALVGLGGDAGERYPHQFSGGQRQRVGIARALALKPRLLVADEAVSALDVSIQAQVLDLLKTVSGQFDLSVLFITHDLRVAAQICDRIAVMRHGQLVELDRAATIFYHPQHEYTRRLIDSVPGKAWNKPDLRALPDPSNWSTQHA
ncbi:MAG: ABC transporter ATP-binding protein [Achromobacter pulmonis]|uniref:Glutathione import ATP-binding protein GsiA n=1 Tax=Achromobacter pulmonis TaxID=1389932 RepID=A0A6S7CG58_9BURK|nr:ABC transporter ATP-binding protein [Achromobacter pulmonis]MCF7770717.1 ABC transporter ATP-binding protein [Achromobacter pulmonis]MPT29965.1 ABC transporter ATP-binding protein [Achromobacter sp.]CAB3691113.1 Glutathione import ATP-binding protein GsiA [Achromobacter pulmonis]CAB3829594.1 Glutathione import ATP-binding protein GsiA [Achromobacter pulmonis]